MNVGGPNDGLIPHLTGAKPSQQYEDEEESLRMIREEGKKVGVDLDERMDVAIQKSGGHAHGKLKNGQYVGYNHDRYFNEGGGKVLADTIKEIMDKGGKPFGDTKNIERRLEEIAREGKETNEHLRNANRPGLGAPGGGAVNPGRK